MPCCMAAQLRILLLPLRFGVAPVLLGELGVGCLGQLGTLFLCFQALNLLVE